VVEPDRPQKCWISKARIQTFIIFNSSCFSVATMVMQIYLNVKLDIHCLSCFICVKRSVKVLCLFIYKEKRTRFKALLVEEYHIFC
jgi:hypothetical protein